MTHVDARGLLCPAPLLRLARVARDAPDGTRVDVWATDLAAEPDVRAWARMRGHEFLGAAPLGLRAGDDDGAAPGDAVVISVRVVRPGRGGAS